MKQNRENCFNSAARVVVKVGSNVLTEDHGLNISFIRSITSQINTLRKAGHEVILVSSGAMAAGIKKMGMARRPDEIPKRQAIAAIGQAGLILEYESAFARYDIKVAQILLNREDLSNRVRHLNARNTINTLLSWDILPVVNENDTVVVEEIKFGDNDNLAAMITLLLDADILINLSDIDGLFTKDPRTNPDAELIPVVTNINKNIEKIAGDIPGALGTGGMQSKIKAARKLMAAGIPMIIAKGAEKDILIRMFDGENLGTFFAPKKERLPSRKCWIAFNLKPKGDLVIDDGAASAITANGKSLLPGGIISVEGDFQVGAPVRFKDTSGTELGIGLVNYSSSDIIKIKGLKTSQIHESLGHKPYDEIIHRDNMAVIEACSI